MKINKIRFNSAITFDGIAESYASHVRWDGLAEMSYDATLDKVRIHLLKSDRVIFVPMENVLQFELADENKPKKTSIKKVSRKKKLT